jgi:hypothetical protein
VVLGGRTLDYLEFLFAAVYRFWEEEPSCCLSYRLLTNFQIAGFRGQDPKEKNVLLHAAAYAYSHRVHVVAMDVLKVLNIDA